jgi:Mg2+/Co2+ transporter CorB
VAAAGGVVIFAGFHPQYGNVIGSILVGNNLVNILASALATSVLIELFGDAGVAYATLIMTLLVLIFSEVLPKTYAIRHADRVALYAGPLLRPVIAVLSPVTRMVEVIVRNLRLFACRRRLDRFRYRRLDRFRYRPLDRFR